MRNMGDQTEGQSIKEQTLPFEIVLARLHAESHRKKKLSQNPTKAQYEMINT